MTISQLSDDKMETPINTPSRAEGEVDSIEMATFFESQQGKGSIRRQSLLYPTGVCTGPKPSALQLTTLPPELHLLILENLRSDFPACLGLTCKMFYAIHRKMHKNVKFDAQYPCDCGDVCKERVPECRHFGHRSMLPYLLYDWMNKAGYELANSNQIFVRQKEVTGISRIWRSSAESIEKLEWMLRFGEQGKPFREVRPNLKKTVTKVKRHIWKRSFGWGGLLGLLWEQDCTRVFQEQDRQFALQKRFLLQRVYICQLWSPKTLRRPGYQG